MKRFLLRPVATFMVGMKSRYVPALHKVTVIGSIIYLIAPIDFIPDAIPILGLTDDAGAIIMSFLHLLKRAKEEAPKEIENKLDDWTGGKR